MFQFHQENTTISAAKTFKGTYANYVVDEKTCRRWCSAGGVKSCCYLKDKPRAGCTKNSILSNCKLPLMKIQPALLED
ncbi:unnamed protein product [Hymenolepis diminuta]|uniref:Uncharacterized protein n=1 Tax=Hymenolepis diminuta TaxID=6216 RepID=A0A564YWH3_HYMDI|nr:unnamed protein product [Hymenolepis diminuta]